MWIGGDWLPAENGETFASANPYTGEDWARFPRAGARDVDRAVQAAHAAFTEGDWPRWTASARGAALVRLSGLIAENADRLAEIEVRDNGKLLAEMSNQCRYMANWYAYYGGMADKVEGRVPPIDKPGVVNMVTYEPVGVCALITPWNSPLLLLAWKLAPALAAGNTVVIKPSEYTTASTVELMHLVEAAGIPPGVVNVVTGFGQEAGMPLVTHPLVRKVAFTGGEAAGREINAAAARDFKKVTLELGGKSPNIVFDDADLDAAVPGAVSGIFAASGQTCIAGSRLLLHESLHDEFLDRLVGLAKAARLGDPMDPETNISPVATAAQHDKILSCIETARGEGARCVLGGNSARPAGSGGYFVEPTIFDGVRNDMRIAQEEVFGPVLSVLTFRDEHEAVAIANDVLYGLAAGVWTCDLNRALRMSRRLQAGTVWVNTYRSTSYTTPFGGWKRSGLGHENGREAIMEYLQPKSVWLAEPQVVANPFIRR
ncbi:Aldehyde dehydrogenase [Salipiger mucosus DSM 16094]|uniref:Aldehyde dehydrogenase n=2 Tax=Salipiger mucosus TaxID=263378 RepID=S9QAK4_9RHOB|nr:Aldehyde dehydrogenase [Salipiger mucosus DSM 16094]